METLGTGAAQLNLLFQIGSARSIYFDFNTDVSGYTFEFVFKKNKGARVKTLSLTLGSGISFPVYVSDQILVSFSTTNTSIEEGEYYWELRKSNSNICLINGFAYFSYDAPSGTVDSPLSLSVDSQVVSVSVSNISTDLVTGTYSTELTFDEDEEIYKDLTSQSVTFTLASTGNNNGRAKFLRLNKPTAVTFPANFEAASGSAALDATKLNVYGLMYFSNWNGSGTARVIYSNQTFTAI